MKMYTAPTLLATVLGVVSAIAVPSINLVQRDGSSVAYATVGPIGDDQPDDAATSSRAVKRQLSVRPIGNCPADAPNASPYHNVYESSVCKPGVSTRAYMIECSGAFDTYDLFDGACNDDEVCVDWFGPRQIAAVPTSQALCVSQDSVVQLAMGQAKPFFWRHVNPPPAYQPPVASQLEIILQSTANDGTPYWAQHLSAIPEDENDKPTGSITQCNNCNRLYVKDWPAGTTTFGIQVNPMAMTDSLGMQAIVVK